MNRQTELDPWSTVLLVARRLADPAINRSVDGLVFPVVGSPGEIAAEALVTATDIDTMGAM